MVPSLDVTAGPEGDGGTNLILMKRIDHRKLYEEKVLLLLMTHFILVLFIALITILFTPPIRLKTSTTHPLSTKP